MSYILQALKRAEEDRRAAAAAAPGPARPVAAPAEHRRRSVLPVGPVAAPRGRPQWLWPAAVGLGLAVHALVIGAVYVATRSSTVAVVTPPSAPAEKPEPLAASPAVAQSPPAPAATEVKPPQASTEVEEKRARPLETKDAAPMPPKPATAPASKSDAVAIAPNGSSAHATPPAPAPSIPSTPAIAWGPAPGWPTAVVPAVAHEPDPDPRAPLWQNHLSTRSSNNLWLKEELEAPKVADEYQGAALRIEVLVWAPERAKRMVYLNGRRFVEGEKLDDGTVVEQIARDGVILVHDGKRVRLRAEAK
jgi:hypothetical protein